MKLSPVILAVSLAANATLAGIFVFTQSSADNGAGTSSDAQVQNAKKADTAAKVTAATEAKTWERLKTSNMKDMVAQLRAMGFPDSIVRAILSMQIHEQFAARRKEFLPPQEEVAFWKKQHSFYDPKRQAVIRQINREETAMLKELLGVGAPENEEVSAYQRRAYGNLPKEKMDQLQNIMSDYGDLSSEVYFTANGVMLPEDQEKLAYIEKEKRADIAQTLTPEELEAYDLRSSSTANNLRRQLAGFNPSEDEFRTIFKLQQAFDQQNSPQYGPLDPDQQQKRRDAQQQLLAQVQSVLPADRYAEYKQASDPANQTVNQLVARLDLPLSAASQVTSVQQDITQRATAIRNDTTLSTSDRTQQLTALSQEASTKISTVLGTRGLDAYKQYGGNWMQNLVPRTPPR